MKYICNFLLLLNYLAYIVIDVFAWKAYGTPQGLLFLLPLVLFPIIITLANQVAVSQADRFFLSEWDGEEISVTQLREQLGISVAVWKDLMKDNDVKALMKKHGVVPVGRAANRKWTQSRDLCA